MSFGKIVNGSFEIAWRHKLLWVFGLFAGGGGSIDVDMFPGNGWGSHRFDMEAAGFREAIEPFIGILTATLIVTVLLGAVILLVCHLISVPALIDSVNRIRRGDGHWKFGQAFSTGIDFLLPMLGLILMAIFAGGAVVAVIVGVIIIAAQIGWVAAVLLGIMLFPVLLAAIWIISSIVNLTERVMVVRRTGLGDALEEAFRLFRANLVDNLLIFLIEIAFIIAFSIAGLIIFGIVAVPIAALNLLAGSGWVATVTALILVGIPLSLVVGGFTGTVSSNLYTLFYFELVEPSRATIPASSTPPAAV
ncbi:MAG: hypothetical protein ABIE70_08015 [bacterium]